MRNLADKYYMRTSGEGKFQPVSFHEHLPMGVLDVIKHTPHICTAFSAHVHQDRTYEKLNLFMNQIFDKVEREKWSEFNLKIIKDAIFAIPGVSEAFTKLTPQEAFQFGQDLVCVETCLKQQYVPVQVIPETFWDKLTSFIGSIFKPLFT